MTDYVRVVPPLPPDRWEWYGSAGHFIMGHKCRFHLFTKVGDWAVSTVGELWPERTSREISAAFDDADWYKANKTRKGDDFDAAYMKRFGFDTLGAGDRTYETMVFRAAGGTCASAECNCGEVLIADHTELDFRGYTTRRAAREGHLELCHLWAARLPAPMAVQEDA